jgi:hypothetical protein
MRELLSEVDAEVYDIRGVRESHPELYDRESYGFPASWEGAAASRGEWYDTLTRNAPRRSRLSSAHQAGKAICSPTTQMR